MTVSKTRFGTAVVTIAALATFVGACGSSSKSTGSASTTTAPAAPAALTITAGDYSFEGVPATLPAGIQNVTFVNKGSVAHEMAFVRVTPGTTPTALFDALKPTLDGGPFPASFLSANGVHDTEAGETAAVKFNLPPGDYIAICTDTGVAGSKEDGKPHFARGMSATVKVTGTGGDTVPTAEASITAHDYGFETTGLKAGEQTIAFENTGPAQLHFAQLQAFPKGTTIEKAKQDFAKLLNSNGPPPAGVAQPEEVATSQLAGPGEGNTFTATLEQGRTYVIVCFISDKTGGPPHAIGHQMYKFFTVS